MGLWYIWQINCKWLVYARVNVISIMKTWGHRPFKKISVDEITWGKILNIVPITWHGKFLFYNSERIKKLITSCHQTLELLSHQPFSRKWNHYIRRHSAFKWPVTLIFYSWFLKFKPIYQLSKYLKNSIHGNLYLR